MKKYLSIFTALAFTGSFAVLNAIDVPQDATDALAAGSSATGGALGLSIEARGAWIQSHGTSDSRLDGTATATNEAYKLSNSSGFGGGATLGYDIANSLAAVVSFDYRAISTRKWDGTKPQGSGTNQTTIEQTTNTSVIGIGLRPSVAALGGTFYAGMGFAMVLPYKSESTAEVTLKGVNPAVDGTAKLVTTNNWNLGLGVYAELGYNYAINDMLFVGVGVRGLVATANNDGKSSTRVASGTASTMTTVSFATGETKYAASGDPTKISAYQSEGITDMTVSITVGARF